MVKLSDKIKYENLFVVSGKIEVLVADEKGKVTGTTELLLKDVVIKVPKQDILDLSLS